MTSAQDLHSIESLKLKQVLSSKMRDLERFCETSSTVPTPAPVPVQVPASVPAPASASAPAPIAPQDIALSWCILVAEMTGNIRKTRVKYAHDMAHVLNADQDDFCINHDGYFRVTHTDAFSDDTGAYTINIEHIPIEMKPNTFNIIIRKNASWVMRFVFRVERKYHDLQQIVFNKLAISEEMLAKFNLPIICDGSDYQLEVRDAGRSFACLNIPHNLLQQIFRDVCYIKNFV